MREKDIKEKKLKKALIKRALGYDSEEVIEEYVKTEEGVVLNKKKVTIKSVPPDVSALKILLDYSSEPLSSMTEEQLNKEKERLLNELLKKQEKEEEKNCKASKSKKKSKKDL